jgi:hypothetical protein
MFFWQLISRYWPVLLSTMLPALLCYFLVFSNGFLGCVYVVSPHFSVFGVSSYFNFRHNTVLVVSAMLVSGAYVVVFVAIYWSSCVDWLLLIKLTFLKNPRVIISLY